MGKDSSVLLSFVSIVLKTRLFLFAVRWLFHLWREGQVFEDICYSSMTLWATGDFNLLLLFTSVRDHFPFLHSLCFSPLHTSLSKPQLPSSHSIPNSQFPIPASKPQRPSSYTSHHHSSSPQRQSTRTNTDIPLPPLHSRPGILVLINDADWELEGEENYEVQPSDNILFVSTLHGG